jgi:histidinol-phosphate aminotransferase
MEYKKIPTINTWIEDIEEYQVANTIEDLIEKYSFNRSQIIRLAGNESTMGSSPKAIQAAQEAARVSNYYEDAHSEKLIKALELKFTSYGLNMDNLAIAIGNGMDSIIDQIGYLFLGPNSSVLIHEPSFPYYELVAKRLGAKVKSSSRIDFQILVESTEENTKIIFLCSPNNPTGELIEIDLVESLLNKFPEKLVFVDHAYIDFTERDFYDAYKIIHKYPNLMIGYTFSKAYALAGFRVGYALMHKELQLKFLKSQSPFLLSKASLAAALAALEDKEHLQKIIYQNSIGKNFLYQEFTKLGLEFLPSEANFILFKTTLNSMELNERLLKEGLIIRRIPKVCEKSLRVTIGSLEENQKFIDALRKCIV